ncbi:MAG: hypothetical protein CL928_15970, partial [Deltaproteobacteria bacterium]|nr:hypothetical protein [Deltaproteobacteria bacterium]
MHESPWWITLAALGLIVACDPGFPTLEHSMDTAGHEDVDWAGVDDAPSPINDDPGDDDPGDDDPGDDDPGDDDP